MSYQVLARKWRPKSFATLIGQEHVVRALSHALATGRLHHAWLFTGTRGVGKTTISRILAKALNCETGITAEPCGKCSACQAIDADRFPDYVEMDAASNRGVDDMAALLDQAAYVPVQGRFKVYMIDEVHMLTGHAFNAMLKTLEEPPEHVKFILATTDPQKIPVTVLSRCLQFNLKQMPTGHIVDHLSGILAAEAVPFEAPALRHLAKAASGSMRDALSLLDQAIAHGAGKVEEEQVTNMLGTVGDDHLYAVLDALSDGDVDAMLSVADRMEARSLSFDAALQALASLFHRIALTQFAPAAIADEAERGRLAPYSETFDAEFLQLAYQIAIHGRDELSMAPDDYAGFTMTLLRLHAFRPEQPVALDGPGNSGGGGARARAVPPVRRTVESPSAVPRGSPRAAPAVPTRDAPPPLAAAAAVAPARPDPETKPKAESVAPQPVAVVPEQLNEAEDTSSVPPWEDLPPEAMIGADAISDLSAPFARAPEVPRVAADASGATPPSADEWHQVLRALKLGGMVRELAQHCEWVSLTDGVLRLRLSKVHHHLLDMNATLVDRLQEVLSAHYGMPIKVRIELGEIAGETPAQREEMEKRARHADAVEALECDPFVRELIERFDATLVETSVKPL
jgi:DNA polymerase-3 subunit gamma/tau